MKNSTFVIVFMGLFILYVAIGRATYNMSQKIFSEVSGTRVKIEKIQGQ